MSGDFLLDTNIVTAILGGDQALKARAQSTTGRLHVPCIVIGELYYGANNSKKKAENLHKLHAYTAAISVIAIDEQTAEHYGLVKTGLKTKGRPIPENDIWIATVAIQHDLTLVTRDNHFSHVDGLRAVAW